MKSTGIIRKVDELGRIVLPMEIRKTYGIKEKDGIEIYINGEDIILRKHQDNCMFCGNSAASELVEYNDLFVCKDCIELLNAKK